MKSPGKVIERPETELDGGRRHASPPTRVRIAQALSLLALVSALVGAVGPAERVRTSYTWPPATLPAAQPDRSWYTPLLLIRHRPETIAARVPCRLPPRLAGSSGPLTVLATARRPERVEGLALRAEGGRLRISLGEELLDEAALAASASGAECAYELRLGADRWSLRGGPRNISTGGPLESMPKVTGLFSSLDLRGVGAPSIEVTTAVHATRTLTRQTLAWTLALLAIAVALLLVAFERVPRKPWRRATRLARAGFLHIHAVDGVVVALLLGWWVLAPAVLDDGWILERVDMYSTSGGFSVYYNGFGTNLPSDYWVEWGQHVLADMSRGLVFLRLPALVALATCWVLCRVVLARVLREAPAQRGFVLWAMASAFLVGALAWGMTLRPEPIVALLVAAVFACAVRFSERGSTAPLAAITALVPLALTAHHSGVVALAPVLVCGGRVVRWARSRPAEASALVTCAIALLFVLLFVGSDLEQRREEAGIHRVTAVNWRDELMRYDLLSDYPSATTARRATVALIVLVVLAWAIRRRRTGGLLVLPGAAVVVALLLLVVTPSKWPTHFGAMLALLAVAVGAETARFREEADRRASRALPYAVLGVAVAAAAWSWEPRTPWNPVDLRTLEWTLGLESWFPLVPLVTLLPLILVGLATAIRRVRRRGPASTASVVASWTPSVLAIPVIAFTVGVLVADSVTSSPWTLGRQNLQTLGGNPGCGLGDDLVTSVGESVRPLALAGAAGEPPPGWVPPAPVAGVRRVALAPVAGGFASSPWAVLPAERQLGLFVAGTPSPTDRLSLEWGRIERGGIVGLGSDEIDVDFVDDLGAAIVSWRLVSGSELPVRRVGADVVRVTLRSDHNLAAAVAVTSPVTYRNQTVARQLRPAESRSLLVPKLVTYFPCVRQPVLRDGRVEVPDHVVASDDFGAVWPLTHFGSSPFKGVLDLYRLEQLPLADSDDPPHDVFLYRVVQDIPGSTPVAPMGRTWST